MGIGIGTRRGKHGRWRARGAASGLGGAALLAALGLGLGGCGLLAGNVAPVAIVEANPTRGEAPLTVEFDASRSYDPDGLIVSYLWDFGDGTTAEGLQARHTYTQNGIYLVTLTVIDSFGARDQDRVRIVVGNPPPRAILAATPTSGWPPLTVTFDGSASFDPEGEGIVRYEWDFGDGGAARGARVSHTFREPGIYEVRLTVTDADGASSVASLNVHVLGFASAWDVRVGEAPTDAVAADFNGDGLLDVAIVNSEDDSLSLLLGREDGTLGGQEAIPVSRRPVSLALGDLNGDDLPDLVVAHLDSGAVLPLLNRGDGSFVEGERMAVARWASAVALEDFDRDGALDLVVADVADDEVSVLLGDGEGGFVLATEIPVGSWPSALATGDFNGDGRPDLAVAHFLDNSLRIFIGNGVGGFRMGEVYELGPGPTALLAHDLDGDGALDLVSANAQGSALSVLRGRGDGRFRPPEPVPVGAGPRAVAVGDFDGDGVPDLAAANSTAESVTVLLGDGLGRFPDALAREFPVLGSPTALLAGNFSGSAAPDLLVVRFDSGSLSLLLNLP